MSKFDLNIVFIPSGQNNSHPAISTIPFDNLSSCMNSSINFSTNPQLATHFLTQPAKVIAAACFPHKPDFTPAPLQQFGGNLPLSVFLILIAFFLFASKLLKRKKARVG